MSFFAWTICLSVGIISILLVYNFESVYSYTKTCFSNGVYCAGIFVVFHFVFFFFFFQLDMKDTTVCDLSTQERPLLSFHFFLLFLVQWNFISFFFCASIYGYVHSKTHCKLSVIENSTDFCLKKKKMNNFT